MGLLDGLLNEFMRGGLQGAQPGSLPGAQGAGSNAVITAVLQLLEQNGGISGILAKMQQAGYGAQAQSWIGTGQNQPISPDVLSQIFGQGQLSQIAQQLGLSHQDAAGTVAQALPQVVDHMTPDGSIPADHDDLVSRTLQELTQRR
ncbi:MAG TPA: YidB family protein [Casimicrobiaceae bacterium]|nr:YidB family protein [Casimicrobiaceae bacterium]